MPMIPRFFGPPLGGAGLPAQPGRSARDEVLARSGRYTVTDRAGRAFRDPTVGGASASARR